MRLAWRTCSRLLLVAALSATGLGCVDVYKGSWVEFELGPGTQVPSDIAPEDGQPPSGTHYEFWVVTGPNAFHLADFLVSKQFDSTFPCFIEIGRSRYPGLHSTKFYDKLLEDALSTGDPTTPDMDELGLLADADKRRQNLAAVEGTLKAVVGYDPNVTPAVLADLKTRVDQNAAIDLTDKDHNDARLAICQEFFDAHPDFYVGQDKVFSLPLAGHWYGMVKGTDPRSQAPVGGAGFTVPVSFEDFDYFWMTWQFNDPADPRINTVGPSAVGYHYMSGTPERRTRRTINVELQNEQFSQISGHMAIFPGIHEDGATF